MSMDKKKLIADVLWNHRATNLLNNGARIEVAGEILTALDKTEKECFCNCDRPEYDTRGRMVCTFCGEKIEPSPKVDLPEPIKHDHDFVANVADLTDGFNKMLDYLRAKGGEVR